MEHSVPMESDLPTSQAIPLLNNIEIAPGPSRKRSRSPSSPSYPDATTFLDGEPAASESPELQTQKDLSARTGRYCG
ncbi:hypothetical protein Tco_0349818 [Tanacetum coccineum]